MGIKGRMQEGQSLSFVGDQLRVCMEQISIASMSPDMTDPPSKKQIARLDHNIHQHGQEVIALKAAERSRRI